MTTIKQSSRHILGPLTAPTLGAIPVALLLLINYYLPLYVTLGIGAAFILILLFLSRFYFRKTPTYTLRNSIASYLIIGGVSLIPGVRMFFEGHDSLLTEMVVLIVFLSFYLSRRHWRNKIARKRRKYKDYALLQFSFDVSITRVAIFLLALHLLITTIYLLLFAHYRTAGLDFLIIHVLLTLFIICQFVYEFIHFRLLRNKLKEEKWLPIINENGGVNGKIAESIAGTEGSKYMYPVVRVALTSQGRIFLGERPEDAIIDPKLLDHPFEANVYFQETLDDAVASAVESNKDLGLEPRFMIKYTFQNENAKRLVYLYCINILDHSLLNELKLPDGKWWTSNQVKENLQSGIFSELFEQEFDFLDSTVLSFTL